MIPEVAWSEGSGLGSPAQFGLTEGLGPPSGTPQPRSTWAH